MQSFYNSALLRTMIMWPNYRTMILHVFLKTMALHSFENTDPELFEDSTSAL